MLENTQNKIFIGLCLREHTPKPIICLTIKLITNEKGGETKSALVIF